MHPLTDLEQCFGQAAPPFGGLLEEVVGDPLGRLASEPRKPGQLRDQVFECTQRITAAQRRT